MSRIHGEDSVAAFGVFGGDDGTEGETLARVGLVAYGDGIDVRFPVDDMRAGHLTLAAVVNHHGVVAGGSLSPTVDAGGLVDDTLGKGLGSAAGVIEPYGCGVSRASTECIQGNGS